MSILKILSAKGIEFVCSKNEIVYAPNKNGEMKKVKNIFGITGFKDKIDKEGNIIKGNYPIFSNEDYGDYGYCILYTGEIEDSEGIIVGIDVDDYRDIPVKDKLEALGFDWSICKDYPWITKSAKNGVHILCKYSDATDITTTNIIHQDKKSCIDIRGSGGKLICAGSKSNIGTYSWVHNTPTEDDEFIFIKKLNPTLYDSIINHQKKNSAGLYKNQQKQKELKSLEKKPKPNINYIDNPNDFDLEMFRVMLSKLDMDVELYGDWCRIGMCLHNEFGGNEVGLNLLY
jgi:hypothetical protein